MRLDKYLADMGAGTRSEIKKAVRAKSVTINGAIVRDPSTQVFETDVVCFHGKPVTYEANVYYMLHKPAGIISAASDSREKTVVDLITDPGRKDLFPVGRLDRDTEGLLLITNDGALAHRLLSPKHHVDKIYLAVVSGTVTADDISAFQNGMLLEDGTPCRPAGLEILSPDAIDDLGDQAIKNACCRFGLKMNPGENPKEMHTQSKNNPKSITAVRVTIHEGKFHQIKRMFLARGKEVLYLKRISMGSLTLDPDLPAGAFRRLTEAELEMLRQSAPQS